MSEKDLDIAIEKCERIMEFDTRTLENQESENGHIFEKVYDLLQFLRQFQFSTDTKGCVDDMISRQAALDALGERPVVWSDNDDYTLGERNQYDMDRLAIETVPSAQPGIVRCKDCKYGEQDEMGRWFCRSLGCQIGNEDGSGYCADAERRTDD